MPPIESIQVEAEAEIEVGLKKIIKL